MEELIIEADTGKLDEVLEFVNRILDENGVFTKTRIQIDIAVEEIFVNIANYAYQPENGMATIRVEVSGNPANVEITFLDSGKPYNPLEKEDPNTKLSAEERDIGGLGIFMVKQSMDNMDYEFVEGKNKLTITKNFE